MAKINEKKRNKNWIWYGLGIILIAAFSFYFMQPQTTTVELPASVNVTQASELRNAGAFVLDVRQPEEWEQVHIPDAVLIPLGELASRVDEVPKDQKILVVCRSGNRSQQGRDILLAAGFSEVTSMNGGVTLWQTAGFPVVSGP